MVMMVISVFLRRLLILLLDHAQVWWVDQLAAMLGQLLVGYDRDAADTRGGERIIGIRGTSAPSSSLDLQTDVL